MNEKAKFRRDVHNNIAKDRIYNEQKSNDKWLSVTDSLLVIGSVPFCMFGPKWAIFLVIIICSLYISIRIITNKIINVIEYNKEILQNDMSVLECAVEEDTYQESLKPIYRREYVNPYEEKRAKRANLNDE
jgi:hypothetical protein